LELIHIKKQTKAYNPNTPSKLNPERMFQSKVYMEEYLKTQIDFFDSITASDEDAERYRKQWPKTETVGRIFTEGAAE
jgi:hypothetical protein